MPSRHRLGTFDNAQALTAEHTPYNLVTVVFLEGAVDTERLRAGLAALTRVHPMLRARVVAARGRRFLVDEDAPPVPLEVAERVDESSWTAAVEAELARRIDLGKLPLGRCVLVDGSAVADRSELVLSFPHVILDGQAATHLVAELLGLLGSGADEQNLTADAAVPPSADDLLPAAWRRPRRLARSGLFLARQMADEMVFRWRTRGHRQPSPPHGSDRCRILANELSADETDLVSRAARRRRLSITAVLEAAMLLAVVRHRYGESSRPHRYFAFPVLRRYLDPPVADDVVRCYVTLLRLEAEVGPPTDLWELATDVHHAIDRSMRRGERFLAALWSHFSMRMVFRQQGQRMATTALSYTGATPLDTMIGGLTVRSVRAFVSNFALGPEYAGQARLFRGRIWIDVVYLDGDMDEAEARTIAATLQSLLVDGARRVLAEAES